MITANAFATGIAAILYAVFVTSTVATVLLYGRVRARYDVLEGAIPRHVVEVGTVVLLLTTQALALLLILDVPPLVKLLLLLADAALLGYGNVAVGRVTYYEYRRYRDGRPRPRLPSDR